jgi:two-component system sensor histidine kinase KdpD
MIAIGIDAHVAIPNVSMVFVVPVVISAAVLGAGPALLSAVLGALAYNYFLTEPRYTLEVADPANILAIGLLLCTGAIVSALSGYLSRASIEAAEGTRRAAILGAYAEELMKTNDRIACCSIACDALSRLVAAPVAILLGDRSGLAVVARTQNADLTGADVAAAASSAAEQRVSHGGVYPDDASDWDFHPLQAAGVLFGAVGVTWQGERPAQIAPVISVAVSLLASRLAALPVTT